MGSGGLFWAALDGWADQPGLMARLGGAVGRRAWGDLWVPGFTFGSWRVAVAWMVCSLSLSIQI